MSFYLELLATQEPFTYGNDENDRVIFACNYRAKAWYPVDKFEEEIAKVLYDAGLISGISTDTFIGPSTVAPTGAGPFIHISRTSGMAPNETHNGTKLQNLTCQIAVRAKSYVVARNKAIAIWRALDGLRNTTITAA